MAPKASSEGVVPALELPADVADLLRMGETWTVSDPFTGPDGSITHFIGEKIHAVTVPALNPILPDFVSAEEVVVEPLSFIDYISLFKSSTAICKASLGQNQILAILDYHGSARAGDRDAASAGRLRHTITLKCPFDRDYAKWRAVLGGAKTFDQRELAEFIEDMIHTISNPPAADLLESIADLKIDRAVKFKSFRNEENGNISFAYEEIDAPANQVPGNGKVSLPKEVVIVTPIFQGGPAVELRAKLRHRMDKGVVAFRFAVPGLDNEERIAFRSIGEDVREKTGTPVFYTA